jgi:DNA-binding transcriptional regulator GbsR (MarR family)
MMDRVKATPAIRGKSIETERVKQDFIRDFGDAYLRFGLPRLMGHIVGLLLFKDGPLSLDEITEQLHVSKGPVSQVMSRLRDHGLVVRENNPGDRKDFYRASGDIFGIAFSNHAGLFRRNLDLARSFRARLDRAELPETFVARVEEMTEFYTLMLDHMEQFMKAWENRRKMDQQRA